MKKTIITILIVIIAITIGIIAGVNSETHKKPVQTSSNNIETPTIEKHKEENITTNVTGTEEIENEELDEEQEEFKTDLDKAISIVKQDWGEDDTVYFAQDGQTTTGEYIICVREKDTTNAKIWYTVNVTDGTFVKE